MQAYRRQFQFKVARDSPLHFMMTVVRGMKIVFGGVFVIRGEVFHALVADWTAGQSASVRRDLLPVWRARRIHFVTRHAEALTLEATPGPILHARWT